MDVLHNQNELTNLSLAFLRTKERPKTDRGFSDLTIEELSDYAECIYDVGDTILDLGFDEFYINRLTKEFRYNIASKVRRDFSLHLGCEEYDRWMWTDAFLKYVFEIDGGNDFVRNFCRTPTIDHISNSWINYFSNSFTRFLLDLTTFDAVSVSRHFAPPGILNTVTHRQFENAFKLRKTISDRIKKYFFEIGIFSQNEDKTITLAPTVESALWIASEL